MATVQERIDTLDEAIASGATSVSYDGRTVNYRSLAEMRSIRADLLRELQGSAAPSRTTFATFSRD